jgi:predicted flap endonuclease-1-like 5' DNA nuclease
MPELIKRRATTRSPRRLFNRAVIRAEEADGSDKLNRRIARRLEEVAQLLSEQGANPFRVQAYLNAAQTVKRLQPSVADVLEREGQQGLRKLPGIGKSLAQSIATIVFTGQLPMLHRLRGESDSEALLASVPGVGRVLAARLHHDLGIDTLEQLEAAAHDGRLNQIAGLGAKKVAGIIDSLASRLGRVPRARKGPPGEPPLEEIFDVDHEYLDKVASGDLPVIAPRRFNPNREPWLPILHTTRGKRHYTALFSNTARAHELGKTKDWVVLYYDGRDGEGQCTVITSSRGALAGKRIVRGREDECSSYYGQSAAQDRVLSNEY